MKCILMATLVLGGAGLTAALPAIQDAHGKGKHGLHADADSHLEQMSEALGLTAEQKKALAQAIESSKVEERVKALVDLHHAEFGKAREKMFAEESVRAACKKMAPLHEELAVEVTKLLRDVHKIFTPEQLEKIHEHHDAFMPHVGDHVKAVHKSLDDWVKRYR